MASSSIKAQTPIKTNYLEQAQSIKVTPSKNGQIILLTVGAAGGGNFFIIYKGASGMNATILGSNGTNTFVDHGSYGVLTTNISYPRWFGISYDDFSIST